MESSEKKNNGVILIVLVLVILGLVGYILYDKGIIVLSDKKEVSEKSTKKSKNETDNGNNNKTYTYYEIYESLRPYTSLFINVNSLSDISKEDLEIRVFNRMFNKVENNVTLDEFNNNYKKTIFNEIELMPQDIGFTDYCKHLTKFKYNASTKTFEHQELPPHDCGYGYYPISKESMLYNYEVKENTYTITNYVVYYQKAPDYYEKYYTTYADAKNATNELSNGLNMDVIYENRDKLQKETYTFEIKNGILTLTDYKLV